jgi:hypothetical protein
MTIDLAGKIGLLGRSTMLYRLIYPHTHTHHGGTGAFSLRYGHLSSAGKQTACTHSNINKLLN